ncbi:MAG: ATP-binding cassette domain-containing protein, partial [Deinococcus sp.]|nr:ATP-binding cassette domain-containing protein [Deinococcus sp.]
MHPIPLQTAGLHKSYGGREVVKDVGLSVPAGSLYGLLGPNGAGKTTTLRCLLALSTPTRGQCLIDGLEASRPEARRQIAGMIDSPTFYPNLTARENLHIAAGLRSLAPGDHADLLELVRLTDAADRPARGYSLGMKQRLGIAMTLVGRPRSLILDEPQNGLDPQGMEEMRELLHRLRERGHTVIVSSHLLGEVQRFATHLGVMRGGELVFQGSLAEFRAGLGERLELVCERPEEAEGVLRNAGLPVQRHGAALYLPADAPPSQVARLLLGAGLDWTRLGHTGGRLEDHY